MAEPTVSNFPGSLDDDGSLFADPTNQISLTLDEDPLSDSALEFNVFEAIDTINVPTYLLFDTGEIVYVEAKTDGSKLFQSVTRGAAGTTPQTHDLNEDIVQVINAEYIHQIKNAIIAIETALGANLDNVVEDADHTTAQHDGLSINADRVDGEHVSGLTLKGELYLSDGSELIINTGAITIAEDSRLYDIDTQADAAVDDLDTINGGTTDDIIVLRAESDARTVVVKHDTGNIYLQSAIDKPLANQIQKLILRFNGTQWVELESSQAVVFGYSLGNGIDPVADGTMGDIPWMPALYILGMYGVAKESGSITISVRAKEAFGVCTGGDEIEDFIMTSVQSKSDIVLAGVTREIAAGTWQVYVDGDATTMTQIGFVVVAVTI
jgi:hypothetical protein